MNDTVSQPIEAEEPATILVVDDNQQNLNILEAYLTSAGYAVQCSTSGEDSLMRVAASPPDLILLDVMMPGIDGYEVCERLKGDNRTRLIPIVMVTALSEIEDKVRGIEVGADDFLTKPINKHELFARVRSLLRVHRFIKDLNQSKDDFLAVASHELRTPMTAIKGYLSMILDGELGSLDGEVRSFLLEAYKGNDRLINLIEEMLDCSRLEQGRMNFTVEEVPVGGIIDDVIGQLSMHAQDKGLDLRYEAAEEILPAVKGDGQKVRQVLTNLLGNAVKFTEKGEIVISARLHGGTILISVRDTGPGIAKDDQGRLFKKFSRLPNNTSDQTQGSSGLGLYICKVIVEQFGGEIWVESDLDEGSTFCFTLPIAEEQSLAS